jgi:hypothetical protein
VHEFTSYADLRNFLTEHARRRGFQLRWKPSGGEDYAYHNGSAKCYCCEPPLNGNALAPINPVSERKRAVKVSHRGKMRCSCQWQLNWSRVGEYEKRETWIWHVALKRILNHSGHEVHPAVSTGLVLDSLRRVPEDLTTLLEGLIRSGVTGESTLRRFTETHLQVGLEQVMFKNLIAKTKRSLGVAANDQKEFSTLLLWLLQEMEGNRGKANFNADEETKTIDRVFYMSSDMCYNLERNGCVLIMDTTYKTNRFHWPLLLICGINEHFQTVLLAVALLHHQRTEDFEWVFEQMKKAVSAEAWAGITCVATDGDAAMSGAIETCIPTAHHARCWYHIEQNLRHNLFSVVDDFDTFLDAWKDVCSQELEEEFKRAQADLHQKYPTTVSYLTKNIWKNAESFALCYTKHWCTLGILSTQRVEGMNAKLKGMLGIHSSTHLSVLFEALHTAASDIDKRAVEKMKELDEEWQRKSYSGTFAALIHPHLSRYAQEKVKEQQDLAFNYRHSQGLVASASVFYIQRTTRVGLKRTVKVTATSMQCSCFFPSIHLLPCRHVLVLNQHLMGTPFVPGQVGKRWLRSYMPPAAYKPTVIAPISDPPSSSSESSSSSSSSSIPADFLVTFVQAGEVPAKKRRVGELRGICDTIVSVGAEHGNHFFRIRRAVQQLCQWVEVLVAEPTASSASSASTAASGPSPRALPSASQPSPMSSSSSDELDASSRLTLLNPSLTISQAVQPPKPKSQANRPQNSRPTSQGEDTVKRRKKGASLSLTQS